MLEQAPLHSRTEAARRAGHAVQEQSGAGVIRARVGSAVWVLAVLCALVLAQGALLVSLGADQDNSLVELVMDGSRRLDGPFADVFTFDGESAWAKERLVNWGLAALAYLIAGRVIDRLVRA